MMVGRVEKCICMNIRLIIRVYDVIDKPSGLDVRFLAQRRKVEYYIVYLIIYLLVYCIERAKIRTETDGQ